MLLRSTLADEATSVLVLEPTSERPVAEIIARLAHAYALREEFASSVVRIFSNRRNKCRIIVLYLKDEVWRAPFKSHGKTAQPQTPRPLRSDERHAFVYGFAAGRMLTGGARCFRNQ